MPSDADARKFAATFEPILLFHQDEQFFPMDPKWYIERCALWRAVPKFDDKVNWGEPPRLLYPRLPQIPQNKIAALASETAGGAFTWLGDASMDLGVGTVPAGEAPPPPEERFLDFVGWESTMPPNKRVTATSQNRHAALDPGEYADASVDSRPWYYVEFLTNDDLQEFTKSRSPNGLDLFHLVASNDRLNKPQVLLYHLFYPMHQEVLQGCEDAGEGRFFGTYGGEWACIAVLIDSTNEGRFIGLTSRNVGDPNIVGEEEARVGMTVSPWGMVQRVGIHPKIFVSRGTHGNYLTSGTHQITAFTGGIDLSTGSCGAVETLDDVIAGEVVISPAVPPDETSIWVALLKFFLTPGGLSEYWIGAEMNSDTVGSPEQDASPTQPAADEAAGAPFGKIISPENLIFPEILQASSVVYWNVSPYQAPAPDLPDLREYDFVVDRSKQVWWEPRRATQDSNPLEGPGWLGRWGPRVTNDPHNRRAGMKCPDFLLMFLEGVAIAMNK